MSERFPLFLNAGDGVYFVRQTAVPEQLRTEISAIIGGFCPGFDIGNECQNFHSDDTDNLNDQGVTCRNYYTFQLAKTDIADGNELLGYLTTENIQALQSISIKEAEVTVKTSKIYADFGNPIKPFVAWIYSLCKNPAVNAKGFTRTFLQKTQEKLSGNCLIKIGVDINQENFQKLVRTYLKYGFVKPRFERIQSQNGEVWSCTMEYTGVPYNPQDLSLALQTVQEIYEMTRSELIVRSSTTELVFPPQMYNALWQFLFLNDEYGGSIDLPGPRRELVTNRAELMIHRMATNGTNCEVNYTKEVDISGSRVQFHTHPLVCYAKTKFLIGTPSIPDYGMFINALYFGTFIHQVIALEGVYTVILNAPFILFLFAMDKYSDLDWQTIISVFRRSIALKLRPVEKMRSKKSITGRQWTAQNSANILQGIIDPGYIDAVNARRDMILNVINNLRLSDLAMVDGGFRTEEGIPNETFNRLAALTDFELFTIKFKGASEVGTSGFSINNFVEVKRISSIPDTEIPDVHQLQLPVENDDGSLPEIPAIDDL